MNTEEAIVQIHNEMCIECSGETICHKIAQFCDGFWMAVEELENEE